MTRHRDAALYKSRRRKTVNEEGGHLGHFASGSHPCPCAHLLRLLLPLALVCPLTVPGKSRARCVGSGFCAGRSLCLGILFSLIFSRTFLRNHLVREAPHLKCLSRLTRARTHTHRHSSRPVSVLCLSPYFLFNVYYLTSNTLPLFVFVSSPTAPTPLRGQDVQGQRCCCCSLSV